MRDWRSDAARVLRHTPDDDREGRVAVTSTATTASVVLAAVIAVPMIVAREPLARWLFHDSGYSDVVVVVALSAAMGTFAIFLRDIMRLRFQPWRFAVSALLGGVVAAAVGVIWVVWFDGGVTAVMVGFLAGQTASALYGLAAVRGFIGWRFSWRLLRRLGAFGLPLLAAGAALWGVAFFDRVLLSRLDGLAEVSGSTRSARDSHQCSSSRSAPSGLADIPFLYSTDADEPERELALRARILTYGRCCSSALGSHSRSVLARSRPSSRPTSIGLTQSWGFFCVSVFRYSGSPRSRVQASPLRVRPNTRCATPAPR